jgi:hypothetical protein
MKGRLLASTVVLLVCLTISVGASIARSDESPKGTTRRGNGGHRLLSKGGKGSTKSSKKHKDKETADVTASSTMVIVPPLEAMETVNASSTMIMIPPLPPSLSSLVTEAAENATEVVAQDTGETAYEVPAMQCPLPGYSEFTIDKTFKPFIRYPLKTGDQNMVLSVTDTCSYIIEDLSGKKDTVYSSNPLEWLDAAVYHFGGSPRSRKHGLQFSGREAPSFLDVDLMERGAEVFEVVIPSNSSDVDNGKPISWIFLSKEEAAEFEYFMVSLVRYAPEIFLTSVSTYCGSGPFCDVVGNTVCYHDPVINNTFGIIHLNGDEDTYDDAFVWFTDCVSALDCYTDNNTTTFSYSPCPAFTVNDTSFTFTDDISSAEITFQCPTANSVLLLTALVEKLSIDPFHALAIGGPNEPGSHHKNSTTDCRG